MHNHPHAIHLLKKKKKKKKSHAIHLKGTTLKQINNYLKD